MQSYVGLQAITFDQLGEIKGKSKTNKKSLKGSPRPICYDEYRTNKYVTKQFYVDKCIKCPLCTILQIRMLHFIVL